MTVAKCGAKGLQSSDVPGELENPEDPENPEDLGGLGDVLQGVLRGQPVEELGDVEGKDAQHINNVERGEKKVHLCSHLRVGSREYVKTTTDLVR